jgi:hypothetical protein
MRVSAQKRGGGRSVGLSSRPDRQGLREGLRVPMRGAQARASVILLVGMSRYVDCRYVKPVGIL